MPEHVHEFGQGFNIAHTEEYVWCITCKKKWSNIEITRRLNATEKLSAEDATELRDVSFGVALLDGQASEKSVRAIKAAEAYAAALEGKDE